MDILAQGFAGLMGLGPNTGSKIRSKIDDATGDSVLYRIFSANNFDSNYITLLLDRRNDPAQNLTGQFTISEVLPQYANISSMRNLNVEKVHKLTNADQHWQIFTDANGVVGPDGQPINADSFVPSAPKKQLVAVIDSGYTLPQVPRSMSDAIYGRVPGAVYDTMNGYWTVPCDSLVNLTFIFGGVEVFIHPLDVVMSEFGYKDANGNIACIGSVSMNSATLCHTELIPLSSNQSHLPSVYLANMISFLEWHFVRIFSIL
jgi:Eukaryotic aspartyl protease